MQQTENLNVAALDVMPSPDEVKAKRPPRRAGGAHRGRGAAARSRRSSTGATRGCSSSSGRARSTTPSPGSTTRAACAGSRDEVSRTLYLVMRVYFEKPRTSLGWKGFINDPFMDDSFRIDEGMEKARRFLLDVNELGLPAGTEALDPIAPQYYGDLIAWTAIGARTSESQTHREMSSGLSTPVGFKNGTDGDVEPAVNAHRLRGRARTASSASTARAAPRSCARAGTATGTSCCAAAAAARTSTRSRSRSPSRRSRRRRCRGTSSWTARTRTRWKKPELQPLVLRDVVHQIREGNRSVVGLMVESFIEPGNQPIPADLSKLRYGCSVTDACVGWDTTAEMLRWADDLLRDVLPRRGAP